MSQNLEVNPPVRRYTRADFTALRATLSKVPTARIMTLYYCEADLEAMDCATPAALDHWLSEMRTHLAARAGRTNPRIAEILADARKTNKWSKALIDYLCRAADQDMTQPKLDDSVSVWFKPRVAAALRAENIQTLADLKRCMERRGAGWWHPVPRIGLGKAGALERWLGQHARTLGTLVIPPDTPCTDLVEVHPDNLTTLVPLNRISIQASEFDGSLGLNRVHTYSMITAKNDLEACRAYLVKFRENAKTSRAYQKEIERFLLWCIYVRRRPMSSALTEECEAYKDFLAAPDADWIGQKAARLSERWRPFAGELSPASQRYAVQALRTFFDWLVRVRYLGGNPWITINDPPVAQKELVMDIDKALPRQLWEELTQPGGILDQACGDTHLPAAKDARTTGAGPRDPRAPGGRHAQYRLARAAIFLMGFSGIRREEAANATRNLLKPLPADRETGLQLWELTVLGKRMKWRTVFMPDRVAQALQAHWVDRGHDFSQGSLELRLLSPVMIPHTEEAKLKHISQSAEGAVLSGKGLSPDGLYQMVKATLLKLAADPAIALSEHDRALLKVAAPHALRHTFATHAAAKEMPMDVLQKLLGHASQQTTSIYVQAERTRSIAEVGKLYGA